MNVVINLVDIRLLTFIGIFVGVGICILIARERMVAEVDERLPDHEKIQRTMWSRSGLKDGEMSRVWRLHGRLFPDSSLRFWYIALWILALSWMFFGLSLLQHSKFW